MNNTHIITINELGDVLGKNKYFVEKEEFKEILDILQKDLCLTKSQFHKIVRGANKYAILTSTSRKYVKADIKEIINDLLKDDKKIKIYERLADIDAIFKSYCQSKGERLEDFTPTLVKNWQIIKKLSNKVVQDYSVITEEEVERLAKMANLYNVLGKHVPDESIDVPRNVVVNGVKKKVITSYKRVEDYFISERLANLADSSLISILDSVRDFESFLNRITSESLPEKERFTKKEIQSLIETATGILWRTSGEKYDSISQVFNEYYSQIQKIAKNEGNQETIEEANNLTVKNLIINLTSIVNLSKESIKFTSGFLQGKNVGNIVCELNLSNDKTHNRMNDIFEELRIAYPAMTMQTMPAKTHMKIVKNSSSIFSNLTATCILNATNAIVDCTLDALSLNDCPHKRNEKAALLRKKGFDVNNLYTENNIVDISTWEDVLKTNLGNATKTKITKNIKILMKYVDLAGIHKIMQNNFNLFLIDTLEQDLNRIAGVSTDAYSFNRIFNEYVNARKTYALRSVMKTSAQSGTKRNYTSRTNNKTAAASSNKFHIDTKFEKKNSSAKVVDISKISKIQDKPQRQEKSEPKAKKEEEKVELSFDEKFSLLCSILNDFANKVDKVEDPFKEKRRLIGERTKQEEIRMPDYVERGLKRRVIQRTINLINEVVNSPEYSQNYKKTLEVLINNAASDLTSLLELINKDIEESSKDVQSQYLADVDKNQKKERSVRSEDVKRNVKSLNRLLSSLGEETVTLSPEKIKKLKDNDAKTKAYSEKKDNIWGSTYLGYADLLAEDIERAKIIDSAISEISKVSIDVPINEEDYVQDTGENHENLIQRLEELENKKGQIKSKIYRLYGTVMKNKDFDKNKNPNYVQLNQQLTNIEAEIEEIKNKLSAAQSSVD